MLDYELGRLRKILAAMIKWLKRSEIQREIAGYNNGRFFKFFWKMFHLKIFCLLEF